MKTVHNPSFSPTSLTSAATSVVMSCRPCRVVWILRVLIMKKTFLAICFVSLSGCVFSASLDDLEDSSNNIVANNTTNNVTNNTTNNTTTGSTNNTTTGSTNNTTNNSTSVDCAGLETVLEKRVAPVLRNGIQVDWREDAMLVVVDFQDAFGVYSINPENAQALSLDGMPIPFAGTNLANTLSFDVSMAQLRSPFRFVFAEARSKETQLNVYICNVDQGKCAIAPNSPSLTANEHVQSAFVPTTPPAVMIGYGFNDGAASSKYSSLSLEFNPNSATFGNGNVFVDVPDRDILGLDFSHAQGSSFRVAGGAYGPTKFFGYVASGPVSPLPTCIALDGALLSFKVKTQHGTENMLFRTNRGLILSDCDSTEATITNGTIPVLDFDLVPVEGGDLVAWIEGDFSSSAAKGSIIKGGTTTALTFRDDTSAHYYVRTGKVNDDLVIILAGAEEGVIMIRGTENELAQCYGGGSL